MLQKQKTETFIHTLFPHEIAEQLIIARKISVCF